MDTGNKMNESQKHPELKKLDTKDYIQYDSIHMIL